MSRELREEIEDRLGVRILDESGAGAGCISSGLHLKTSYGQGLFVKTNCTQHAAIMFEGEKESLEAILATKTIRVPKPKLVLHQYDSTGGSAIVMEYVNISSLDNESASELGVQLARLHDYNRKLLVHQERGSRWIGGKCPSVRAIEELRASKESSDERGVETRGSSDDEKDSSQDEDEDEDEGSIKFGKHRLTLNPPTSNNNNQNQPPEQEDAATLTTDRFVPERDTEPIREFGFHISTSCGLIPQVNEWTHEWVHFYARHRLDKSIRELLSDHGDRELSQQWSMLQLKVDKFFTDLTGEQEDIVPALLHGDLWSGNAAKLAADDSSSSAQPIIYDPSSFYGHSEYEFGIARMFGGIPKSFEAAYHKELPRKKLFEKRNRLYQLFHHLNHWNHFGSGYRASSLSLIKNLNSLV